VHEDDAFECRKARRVEVLHDFHYGCGIEARELTVSVGQRTLSELDALPLTGCHLRQAQPPRGELERSP
jgi:hypothetical protein